MAELLQQLVTRQAERCPTAIALVMNDERTNYAALEESSNQLARQLQAVGCVRGDRVCFLTPKSPAAIIRLVGRRSAAVAGPEDRVLPQRFDEFLRRAARFSKSRRRHGAHSLHVRFDRRAQGCADYT